MIALKNPHIRVTVVDKDPLRVRRWQSQHPPIHEPGLRDVLRVARDGLLATESAKARAPNLFFSTDVNACIAAADLVFLSVNTPTKMSGIGAGSATDLFALELAAQAVAENAQPGAIIVEKSTVPCRTAKRIRDIVRPDSLHGFRPLLTRDFSVLSTGPVSPSRFSPTPSSLPRARPSGTCRTRTAYSSAPRRLPAAPWPRRPWPTCTRAGCRCNA